MALSGVLAAAAAVVHELAAQTTQPSQNNTLVKLQALVRHIQALVASSVTSQGRLGIFHDRISNLSPSVSTQSLNGPYEEPLPALDGLNLGQAAPKPLSYEEDEDSEFEDEFDTTAVSAEKRASIAPLASNTPTRPEAVFQQRFDVPPINNYNSRDFQPALAQKGINKRNAVLSGNFALLGLGDGRRVDIKPSWARGSEPDGFDGQNGGLDLQRGGFSRQKHAILGSSALHRLATRPMRPRSVFVSQQKTNSASKDGPALSNRAYDDIFLDRPQ